MSTKSHATVQGDVCTTSDDNVGHFVDINTCERLDDLGPDGWGECDRAGHPLIGWDEWGVWWGTDLAVWVLSEQYYTVDVWGTMYGHSFVGHFVGTVEEVERWCESHGVDIHHTVTGQ